jgi:hypothetical protein
MNDRELLELAAKAAGYRIEWVSTRLDDNFTARIRNENPYWFNWPAWNPIDDDGDALRLAVKLDISLRQKFAMVVAEYPCIDAEFNERNTLCEAVLDDYCAATRRAVVRAAAEMAKTTA